MRSGRWRVYYGGEYRGRPRGWLEQAEHRTGRPLRLPRRPARGFAPRAVHTYDLDYGSLAGGPTEYSGRAGYPTRAPRWSPRGLREWGFGEYDANYRRSRAAGGPWRRFGSAPYRPRERDRHWSMEEPTRWTYGRGR